MKKVKIFNSVSGVIIALLLFVSRSYAKESVCITCHSELEEKNLKQPAIEWKTSIHFENGISCHNCHGGNPDNEELAMDPDYGFIGAPDEEEVPDFCGKCHIRVKQNYKKVNIIHLSVKEDPIVLPATVPISKKRHH